MLNNWVIGTFVTENTPYMEVYFTYLLRSLDKDGAKDKRLITKTLMTEIIRNYGSWTRNVAEKPAVILKQLQALSPEQCLAFVDADAKFEQYPTLFDTLPAKFDIAYHTLSWRDWYGYDSDDKELLTGTMFFRNNKRVHDLCKEWHEEACKTQEWEQKVLARIIDKHIKNGLKVYKLPLEYCCMVSRPGGLEPLVKCEPVISHHQKSREYKRKI